MKTYPKYPNGCRYCTISSVGGGSESRFKTFRYCIVDRQKVNGEFRKHEVCNTISEYGDYVLIENIKRPGRYFESYDDGFNWTLAKSWKGIYEVPQCIHTQQLDVSFMIQTVEL